MYDGFLSQAQAPVISPSFPQDRLTRGVEISTGLDRLKVGFYVEFKDERLFEILGQGKAKAQEIRQVVPIKLGDDFDQYYNCHATGKNGGYAFHISRADVNVFISTRRDYMDTPNVWVDIGSMSCWAPGYTTVINQICKLIHLYQGTVHKNSVSEVHLCADSIGQDIRELGLERYDYWITRANKFFSYYDHSQQKFSGITWNQSEGDLGDLSTYTGRVTETGISVGQGDIMLRVYDKVLEIAKNDGKKSLFASVWSREQDDDEDLQVTRVEFQLRKTVLKQFRIKTLQDLHKKASSLWSYCVTDWARLCLEPFDRNNRHQDRAKINPWWERLQSLQWSGEEMASRRKCLPTKNKRQLEDMLAGVALNLAAINGYTGNDHDVISIWCQEAISSILSTKAQKVDPKTGKSDLQVRMEQKVNEVWPYGFSEIHGPTMNDAEQGVIGAAIPPPSPPGDTSFFVCIHCAEFVDHDQAVSYIAGSPHCQCKSCLEKLSHGEKLPDRRNDFYLARVG
ncbi:hypothetical protein Despr_0400 [Desulfobulbus propionicus DSM 2032]|uniref:Uncharacterized protein n=1 Tax=Desulfobulbus propionicus (strain ATCC 33891 / DSM 2032 / VKM B-1956 / 1pr3) TaxID=577650 RepID=A0A7U4DN16_DESPD|nr:hypothetical protein [Desulfobulbus propionicus]ADW16582.1 hypothetical protein Despr_0400 [Desulfobulbus propionicus DSM 2032]